MPLTPIWRCRWPGPAPSQERRPSVWRSTGAGLHHHGLEGLVNPAARLEPVREEAALAQFGNGQSGIAHLGDEQPLAVAVAMCRALISAAPMARGTNGRANHSLHQILETPRTSQGSGRHRWCPS